MPAGRMDIGLQGIGWEAYIKAIEENTKKTLICLLFMRLRFQYRHHQLVF